VRWLGVLVCVIAAYRLTATPLQTVATTVAAASLICASLPALAPRAGRARAMTALQHVCAALGGFFLFVSIAMR
jgi:hypothetical protein